MTAPTAPSHASTSNDVITRRFDFVLLFDVKDGNPNGDPDFDNAPRIDFETMQGLVSDVSLKRKIRDYVFTEKSATGTTEDRYDIYVLQGNSLESRQKMAYDNLKLAKSDKKNPKRNDIERARRWMCDNFYDVRTFGAVMSTTEFNCGQVRGPVQITFARSIEPVAATEHGITRVAFTAEKKMQETSSNTEMGAKHTLPYGLYRAHGFVNPHLALGPNGTGFTETDLQLLWRALSNMFEIDRSAARGLMATKKLIVFEHSSALGNAPAHRLFDAVRVERNPSMNGDAPARSFSNYAVTIDRSAIPEGITVHELV